MPTDYNGFNYKFFGWQPRPWGYEVRADVTDISSGSKHSLAMKFKKEPKLAELRAECRRRLDAKRIRMDRDAIEDEDLQGDFSSVMQGDFENSLAWLIKAIRAKPSITLGSLGEKFDQELPLALMTWEKFMPFAASRIGANYKNFKKYVINKKFEIAGD